MLGLCRRPARFVMMFAVLFGVPAFAQTPTGRISGVVRDPSAVPREAVTVRATNRVTGTTRSATTGPDGAYTIAGLAPGAYTVTGSLIGFRRATSADVQVEGAVTIDAATEAARLQESIVAEFPGAKHLRVDGSGHYIQKDRPDVVIDSVRELAGCSRPRGVEVTG